MDYLSNFWEYGTTQPPRVTTFGSGCSGSAGPLTLAAAGSAQPWLDGIFGVVVTNVPPTGSVFLGVEPGRNGWPILDDPLDNLGMPGCRTNLWLPAWVQLPAPGPQLLAFRIPSNPSLAGTWWNMQCAATDPTANAVGMVTSNALLLRIGSR